MSSFECHCPFIYLYVCLIDYLFISDALFLHIEAGFLFIRLSVFHAPSKDYRALLKLIVIT